MESGDIAPCILTSP